MLSFQGEEVLQNQSAMPLAQSRENNPGNGMISPEFDLLLSCAQLRSHPEIAGQIRSSVLNGIDWDRARDLAVQHRMLPFLCHGVNAVASDLLPEEVRKTLKEDFGGNVCRNLLLTSELHAILDLFSSRGIDAVSFKGPLTACSAYDSLSLRQFDDLDILVRKPQVREAVEVLFERGYHYLIQAWKDPAREKAMLRRGCAFTVESEDGSLTIDLHWRFMREEFSFHFDLEELWKRLRPVRVGGRNVPGLSIEDSILLHCIHGSKHEWARLEWICVLAEWIRTHAQINWEEMFQRAVQLGSERMLLLGLRLAKEFFHVDLPVLVEQKLQDDRTVEVLAGWVHEGFWEKTEAAGKRARRDAFHLKMRERWKDRLYYLNFLARTWFSPTEEDRQQFTILAPFPIFYYLLRPFRLARDYGLTPLIQFLQRLRG
jgi:hypothetical protein